MTTRVRKKKAPVYPIGLVDRELFLSLFRSGPVVFYSGESIGAAKARFPEVKNISDWVHAFVVDGKRGSLVHKVAGRRDDGVNCHEYFAVPSKAYLHSNDARSGLVPLAA